MKATKILVIGANGQIGTELTAALRWQYGKSNVIAADKFIKDGAENEIALDVLDEQRLKNVVKEYGITQIYLLAAMLSATGEQQAAAAWRLNMQGLISVLEIAKEQRLDKVFWPSSIAVFGPGSPKHDCPQDTIIAPSTVYGISKRAGEHWCQYYFEKHGVDVRSLRYPGLISYTTPPGGGTTDYAVDIFHQALEKQSYTCFLAEDTCLPMMYMPDAIRATLELMNAPKDNVKIRGSYNITGLSFAPCDVAAAIARRIPGFSIDYRPDYRQAIANSWPASINGTQAMNDWGWKPAYSMDNIVDDMLDKLSGIKKIKLKNKLMVPSEYPDFQIDNYVYNKNF